MDIRSICFDLNCHKLNRHKKRCQYDATFLTMLDAHPVKEVLDNFTWNNENILSIAAKWATLDEFEMLMDKLDGQDIGKIFANTQSNKGVDIYASAILNEDENVMKHLAWKMKILPTYSNGTSALGIAVEKNNINAVAILYKHMRQNYLEDILEKYVDKEDVSRLVSLFQKEEKQVGLFVKSFLKSGNDFKRTENNELIAELLLHPAFFQDEVYNNVLLYTAFYSPIDTIFCIFHQIRDLITVDYFHNDLKYSISAYGEDVLSILANFRLTNYAITPEDFREFYKAFFYDGSIPPTNYTKNGSALYYLIQHKQFKLALFILQKTNIDILSNDQRESFLSAIKELSLNLKHIPLASKDERLCWAEALSIPSVSHPSGREAKARARCHILREKSAPPNSRAQILRQIGTQLFYLLNNKKKINLTEVQVMLVKNEKYLMVFIAFNPTDDDTLQKIKENASSITSVLELIQIDYSSDIRWSMHRSKRYSKKLKSRIHNPENKTLAKVLDQPPIVVDSLDNTFEMNKLYLLCCNGSYDKERHAEEILCDAADKIKKNSWREMKFSIYGRKRPCMSCSGRMKVAKIHHYNPNPGYYWYSCIGHQSEESARETLNILMTKVPCVTIEWGTRMRDYDTASESD